MKNLKKKIINILEQGFSDLSKGERKTNKVQSELLLELFDQAQEEIKREMREKIDFIVPQILMAYEHYVNVKTVDGKCKFQKEVRRLEEVLKY